MEEPRGYTNSLWTSSLMISRKVHSQLSGDAMMSTLQALIKESLSGVDPIVPIDKFADLDFRLKKTVFSPSGFISSHFNGNLLQKGSLVRPEFPCYVMPDQINDQHLQLFLGEYVLNSAGYVYHVTGALKETVTDADIPESSWIHLNTHSFRYIIPILYAKYPDMAMEAVVSSRAPPSAVINSTGITVKVPVVANVSVVLPDQTRHAVFSLGIDVETSVKAWVDQGVLLKGQMNMLGFKFGVISSEIGTFDTKDLTKIINDMCKYGVVPFLNVALEKGVEIPTSKGVVMLAPQIQYQKGFMAITTDIDYRP
ncbi:hypothetical protein GEMRC1_007656 [Eukaryota sp. GEM-RC1]